MFSGARGEVIKIIRDFPELQELLVVIHGNNQPERAYNYPQLYRKINIGETVSLNTSAVNLSLGTGGYHFVIPELGARGVAPGGGSCRSGTGVRFGQRAYYQIALYSMAISGVSR